MKLFASAVVLAAVASPALASSLIVNGGFEFNNVASGTVDVLGGRTYGFFTDYNLDSNDGRGSSGGESFEGVVTNARTYHGSFFDFGAFEGSQFLCVNAATGRNPDSSLKTVWGQVVHGAEIGATYEFSFYARNAYSDSPAILDITAIAGSDVLSLTADLNPPSDNGWVRYFARWTGLSDPTTIRIVDNNLAAGGNDFAIDNIALTLVPLPTHMGAAGLAALLLVRRRR